jgi:hypothetical protein
VLRVLTAELLLVHATYISQILVTVAAVYCKAALPDSSIPRLLFQVACCCCACTEYATAQCRPAEPVATIVLLRIHKRSFQEHTPNAAHAVQTNCSRYIRRRICL